MVHLRTPSEIDKLFEVGQIVKEVLDLMGRMVCVGISTIELDKAAEDLILMRGAKPAFKGYHGYPATACISINNEIVHGIPSARRKLKDGDLVSVDMGAVLDGWVGDSARTFEVGQVSEVAKTLNRVTRESLERAIAQVRPGRRLGDIGHAVQAHAEAHGFSVVKDFVGHGVGRLMHEDPQIPNYGTPGTGLSLKPGMVLAIEPMVNEGSERLYVKSDGWTAVTKDGKLSAHWEHSVAVTDGEPRILTA